MIYRLLSAGEIIEDGDEVDSSVGFNDEPRWVKASCIGERAPDPSYPAHRRYRRPSIKWSCKDHHEHSTEWEAQQCILLHDAVKLLKATDGIDPWLPEEYLYWHGTRLEITRKWDAAEQRNEAVAEAQKCPFCSGLGFVELDNSLYPCKSCDGTGISKRA